MRDSPARTAESIIGPRSPFNPAGDFYCSADFYINFKKNFNRFSNNIFTFGKFCAII